MGTSINAFIEYDDTARTAYERDDLDQLCDSPFQYRTESVAWGSLCWDKEYGFFAAIAGVRNDRGIEPLIAPRGLPENLSPAAALELTDSEKGIVYGHSAGWLYRNEILESLQHMMIPCEHLGFPVHLMLEIMAYLTDRLGEDRVRLVWTFD